MAAATPPATPTAAPPADSPLVQQLLARVQALEHELAALRATPPDATPADATAAATPAGAAAPAATPAAAIAMMGTRVVMHQIVAPAEVDALGICRGGQVLSWIDVCAGLAAKTLARGPCVTVSVDAVHFFRPCRLGDIAIIAAMVNRSFGSSMEVGVRVEAEDMATGARRHCCSAYLTFVSLQAKARRKGQKQPSLDGAEQQQQPQEQEQKQLLPRVVPNTSEQTRIYAQAEARRAQRLAARQAAQHDPHRAAVLAACRLRPITHREGCPTLPPPLTLTVSEQQQQHPLHRGSSGDDDGDTDTDTLLSPTSSTAAPGGRGGSSSRGPDIPPLPPQHQRRSNSGPRADDGSSSSSSRRQVPPGATRAYMTQSIHPQHANTLGITFGGQVLSWMEQCAYISASRLRGAHHLTASMDGVSFAASTRVGDILYVTSEVTAIFSSSLEVMISVFGETPASGEVFHCADAFATIVVVDAQHGLPSHIPFQLCASTQEERLRLEGAEQRRAERLAMRSGLAAASSLRPSLDQPRA